MAEVKLCSVDGCTRKAIQRGWCHAHYQRWRRDGDVCADQEIRGNMKNRLCCIPGCGRPARKRDWCAPHYARWFKHGDVRADVPIGKQHKKGEPCSVSGCSRLSHGYGYCSTHLRRFQKHGDPEGGPGRKTASGEAKRFYRDVVLKYDGDKCLAWPFMTDRMGYGMMGRRYVHVRVCELVNGPAPDPEMEAAHSCGNGRGGCCTKRHLRWRTHAENQAEMVEHGHSARGEKCGIAKLTRYDVREIRRLAGAMSQSSLAEKFGVAPSHIWKIIHRTRWAWLDD